MSDEAPDQEQKTEDPSQKKLDDAQKKGDVVKSQEVNNWFMIAGSGLLFSIMAAPTSASLADSLKTLMANADQFEIGGSALNAFMSDLTITILLVALVPLECASAATMIDGCRVPCGGCKAPASCVVGADATALLAFVFELSNSTSL